MYEQFNPFGDQPDFEYTTEHELHEDEQVQLIPRFNVVLHDDNDHSYEYVIEMLTRIFNHSREKAFRCAQEVDASGRVIVDTTHKERAEFKRDQIHGYGADWRIVHCKGSMSASIEPVEED